MSKLDRVMHRRLSVNLIACHVTIAAKQKTPQMELCKSNRIVSILATNVRWCFIAPYNHLTKVLFKLKSPQKLYNYPTNWFRQVQGLRLFSSRVSSSTSMAAQHTLLYRLWQTLRTFFNTGNNIRDTGDNTCTHIRRPIRPHTDIS